MVEEDLMEVIREVEWVNAEVMDSIGHPSEAVLVEDMVDMAEMDPHQCLVEITVDKVEKLPLGAPPILGNNSSNNKDLLKEAAVANGAAVICGTRTNP